MDQTCSDHPARPFSGRLTRRRAFAQTGAGLAALGAAVASSHVAAQEASPPAASPVPDGAPGDVTPEWAALVVDRIPALAQEILDQTGVPGMSIAVVYDDALLYAGGFGVREIGQAETVDADTVFQIASVSKPVSSTVVSAVVGAGTLSWDSRLADLESGFALHDAWPTQAVTLADLFAHRSGLPDHAGDLLEDLGFGREEILHRLRFLTPAYSFRDGYDYTNFGLTAAAVAAAGTAGIAWEDLCRERLYAPLGMAHSSSRFGDFMAEANRATPHIKEGDDWKVTPDQRDPDAQSPAGGVSSTARDLAQWMRLQLGQGMFDGQQLIPAAALAPTHIPRSVRQDPADPATQRTGFYGLGWDIDYDDFGTVQWSHSGAFSLGAATAVYLVPGTGFGVLALTNGYPVGAPEALCLSLLDLARRGEVTRDWLALLTPLFVAMTTPAYGTATDWNTPPATATPALPNDTYLGTYRNDFYGEIEVAQSASGLALRIGPKPFEAPLTHYDRDTFSWQPPGENATVRSGLAFTVGADGIAIGFTDDYLGSGGPGVLTRPEAAAP